MIPHNSFSLFENLAWVEQQQYGSPLEKLMMLRIVTACSGDVFERGYMVVRLDSYATYCAATPAQCADALQELHRRGILHVLAENHGYAEIGLGCWPVFVKTTLADLRRLGNECPRKLLFKSQDGLCWYCGNLMTDAQPHFEHQVPLSRGGPDTLNNLVLSCPTCNHSKGAKTVTEFRAYVIERDRLAKSYRFCGEART